MNLQESGEMYLETIYILQQKLPLVRSIDVAIELGYSKPSVSRAVNLLKKNGYLDVDDQRGLIFTEKGEKTASTIYDRHRTLTDFLVSLGVSDETAAKDACRIEHVISNETFTKIKSNTYD